MPSAGAPRRESSHVPIPTTGLAARRASAISERVPHSPPIAINASAARTTSAFRASPRPVGTALSTKGVASARSSPGRGPSVAPPAGRRPARAELAFPPPARPAVRGAERRGAARGPGPPPPPPAGHQLVPPRAEGGREREDQRPGGSRREPQLGRARRARGEEL